MKIQKLLVLFLTHLSAGAFGFAIGIYALPILIAPPAPSEIEISEMSSQATYTAEFVRDLKGSDALHWGEGRVSIGDEYITLVGELSPGPDYKLYLSPKFVETETAFEKVRPSTQLIGDVETFENFAVAVPPGVSVSQFNTVVIWCETFGEFITSAKFR